MSAFIVGQDHIDLLVDAAFSGERLHWMHGDVSHSLTLGWGVLETPADPTSPWGYAKKEWDRNAIGQILWDTNVDSCAYRYPQDTDETRPGPPEFRLGYEWNPRCDLRYDAVQVLKAIACYEYQSCELPDWSSTLAAAFCESLRARWITRLDGYKQAQWEYRAVRAGVPS
jgi:hypothetical protein